MRQWKRQKAIQTAREPDILSLGFSTFFLNRTNRSGIIKGGVIGGQNQTGKWKIGARFNRKDLAKRIEKIASYAPRISLYNLDAADFISGPLSKIPTSALVYLDPPYYGKTRRLYQDQYIHAGHAKIAELVASIQHNWIVSYDNAEPIIELYSPFRRQTFGLRYSANDAYRGSEIMVFCDKLKVPGAVESWRGIAA
jgi:DNA adenine methylase